MIFKFAFRNVLRNRKRSFLTALTIFFAAIVVGMAQSWTNGMLGVYIDNFIKYQTGHIRVTTEEFTNREKFMPVDELVYDSDELITKLAKTEGVKAVRERIRFNILLGNSNTTTNALGMGIDLLDNEFNLKRKLKAGKISSEIFKRLKGLPTYVSFDIDSIDPAYAPGIGIPSPGGLTPREVYSLVHGFEKLNIMRRIYD